MPTFAYQARDRAGQHVAGTREAPDQRAALEELRAIGLFVTQLAPVGRAARARRAAQAAPRREVVHVTAVATPEKVSELQSSASEPIEHLRSVEVASERVEVPQRPVEQPRTAEAAGIAEMPLPAAPRPAVSSVPPVQPWLRASAKEMALFFRQMNAMLNAGTTVSQALATLGSCASNPGLRSACAEMSARTASGQPWSETLGSYPGLFSKLSVGMISAGEMGGYLDRICQRLADYAERDYNLQQSIKRETWYPKLLVFCSILIPSAVPLVVGIFGQGGNVGGGLLAWFLYIVKPLLLVGVVWGGWKLFNYLSPVALHSGSPREVIDSLKLRIPVVGKTVRALAMAKFCRALGALYAAGMGLNRTLNLAADTCGNLSMAASVRRVIPRVEQGEPLSECLASTGHFSPIVLQMLRTGEMSGALDAQLDKVADFLEDDAETTIKQSVKVLGVVAFLLIAIYIGSTVISSWVGHYNDILNSPELSGN